jgi:L-aminopeptidase/D-esterase-like protein
MKPGPRNLLTDVAGIAVGNAQDKKLRSGVTAILFEPEAVAAVHVMGGAPGTRETDLLAPENTVEKVHALVLSGGSAFGVDAATGVQSFLRREKRGFVLYDQVIPIVPAAILFDLANGGDKEWGLHPPYRELGLEAARNAGADFGIGAVGAGCGALTATVKGGLGSASLMLPDGTTLAALAAVNAMGSVTVGDTASFWAAPFEIGDEFGGAGLPQPLPRDAQELRLKFRDRAATAASDGENTTIAVIATDAELTKAQAKRLAISAHDGFARAIWPVHTPFDGDLVFAAATGKAGRAPANGGIDLFCHAASVMARAIARACFAAAPLEGDLIPAWRRKFGKAAAGG